MELNHLQEQFEQSESRLRRENCMKAALFAAVFMLVGGFLDALVSGRVQPEDDYGTAILEDITAMLHI